jgi:hypothetical protein
LLTYRSTPRGIDEAGEGQAIGRIDDDIGARRARLAGITSIDRCNGVADDGNVVAPRTVGVAIVVINHAARYQDGLAVRWHGALSFAGSQDVYEGVGGSQSKSQN